MYIILLQIILTFSSFQKDYTDIFDSDYTWAVKFIKKNRKLFIQKSSEYMVDTAVITSVIFPEILRYSIFKNYFETKGLELIYTKYGKKYADFSIGYFQMKPSFVEALEKYVHKTDGLSEKFDHIPKFNFTKEQKIRSERIKRLKSFEWQMDYLHCFYIITSGLHADQQWENKNEKIKFFATAYNHGFYKDTEEIKKWIDVPVFPYGANSKSRQYIYSDISCYFFNNNYKKIFK